MSFLDNILQGAGAGIATALATNGEAGPVDVSDSDTPNAGDVLTATSGTQARWLPLGGGGAGITATKVIYPATEAEGEVHATPGTHYLFYLELDFADFPHVWLPDARIPAVTGQTICFTVVPTERPAAMLSLEIPPGETGNYLVIDGNVETRAHIQTLERGTYTCVAVFDSASTVFPNSGFWIVTRSQDTILRRDQDIRGVVPGPIPADATLDEDPDTAATIITSGGTDLPFDGDATMPPYIAGDLLIVLDGGVYEVTSYTSAASWTLRERTTIGVLYSGVHSESRYSVKVGSIYGGRRIASSAETTSRLFTLENDPLRLYPADGLALDGTSASEGPFTRAHAVFGKLNLFEVVDTDVTLTIAMQTAGTVDPALYAGERIALKCTSADATDSLVLNAPTGMQIEGPDGAIGASATFPVRTGAYLEWVLTGATWLLVHYRVYTGS